jgi:hypothetical protein
VAALRDEEVFRFEIPVDDAFFVRRGKAAGDLEGVVDGLFFGDGAVREPLAQRPALQKLHDRVGDPVLRSEIVNREDVRM